MISILESGSCKLPRGQNKMTGQATTVWNHFGRIHLIALIYIFLFWLLSFQVIECHREHVPKRSVIRFAQGHISLHLHWLKRMEESRWSTNPVITLSFCTLSPSLLCCVFYCSPSLPPAVSLESFTYWYWDEVPLSLRDYKTEYYSERFIGLPCFHHTVREFKELLAMLLKNLDRHDVFLDAILSKQPWRRIEWILPGPWGLFSLKTGRFS